MPIWTINGTTLAAAKLKLASGSFRAQGVSVLRLERAADFDATELLAFGAAVVIARDGTPFFQGKIVSIPKAGSAADESQNYDVADAWEDLENTIYQEPWALGASSYLFPRFVFGLGPNALATGYVRITIGGVIANVIGYAVGVGIDLAIGSIPDGELPIPSEMQNMSCAEVIRTALKLHPDWIPWIDHETTPPTFHVSTIAELITAGPAAIALDGSEPVSAFQVRKRDDLLPDSVRIVYELATTIEDSEGETEVYRDAVIDKWPTDGPDGGPRVIGATIPLAGLQMQIQKSRIKTRTIPDSSAHAQAKSFLVANYPHLANVDPAHFTVDALAREFVPEPVDDEDPDPINPQAPRMAAETLAHMPRQLVKGTLEDWMRRRIGRVKITAQISAAAGATADEKAAFEKGTPAMVISGTNATTKIYKGLSQWTAPEDIPSGIAQSVYEGIHAACQYEGSITLVESDVGSVRYHGRVLNLSASLSGWATMRAPIHSVDFDIASGSTTLGFGPPPYLAPQDFLEMQRILRFRPTRWWSTDERASNKLGAETKPSAAGDTVGGFDGPEITFGPSDAGVPAPFSLAKLRIVGADYCITLHPGYLRDILPKGGSGVDGISFIMPQGGESVPLDAATPPEFELALNDSLYLSYGTDKTGLVKGDPAPAVIVVPSADVPKKTTHYQPTAGDGGSGVDGLYYVRLGKLAGTGAEDATWQPFQNSDVEHYHELFTGKNIGTGSSIFKERNVTDDSYEYRRVKGGFGVKNTQETSDVRLDFLATNIGGGHPVLIAPADPEDLGTGAAQFRTIRGLNYAEATAESITQQIKVELAPAEDNTGINQTIRCRGNGVTGSNDAVSVMDGLVTEVKSPDEEGLTADVVIKDCTDPWDAATAPVILRLSFAGGKVVAIDAPIGTGTGERPLAATVFEKYVQSCHWIDDADHSHAV